MSTAADGPRVCKDIQVIASTDAASPTGTKTVRERLIDAAEACLSLARARELLGSGAKARAAAQLALQIAEKHGYEGIARRARAIMGRLEAK